MSKTKKHKFEDIISSFKSNYRVYTDLLVRLEQDYFMTYAGAGMSFYMKSWSNSFKSILDNLSPKILNEEQKKTYITRIEENEFLIVAQEIHELLEEYDLKFNDRFLAEYEYFHDLFKKKVNTKIKIVNSIDELPSDSVFYIPFIGVGQCITTNICDSIELAFDTTIGRVRPEPIYKIFTRNSRDDKSKPYLTYYIHGNFKDSESLVLIDSDYAVRYKEDGENTKFLKKFAEGKTFLFLGASLISDPPIDIIKEVAGLTPSGNGTHFTIKCSNDNNDKNTEDYDDLNNKYKVRTIFVPTFESYSILLCNLLRHSKNEIWIDIPSLGEGLDGGLNNEISSELEKSLNHSKAFLVLDGSKYIKNDIFITLGKYLNSINHKEINDFSGWAVCYINSNDFLLFPGKFNPEEYNAPLGNTIYIIGGEKMYNDTVSNIIQQLEQWTNDNNDDFKGGIKIRVIVIPSPLSDKENVNRLEKKLAEEDISPTERDAIIKDIRNLFEQLKQYHSDGIKLLNDEIEALEDILPSFNKASKASKLMQIREVLQSIIAKIQQRENIKELSSNVRSLLYNKLHIPENNTTDPIDEGGI